MNKHSAKLSTPNTREGVWQICRQWGQQMIRASVRRWHRCQQRQALRRLARSTTVHDRPPFGPGTARSVLLVGQNAHASDASRLLLSLARVLSREFDIDVRILLRQGGALLPRFMDIAETVVLKADFEQDPQNLFHDSGCRHAIFNGCNTGDLLEAAQQAGLSCVALLHEPSAIIQADCLQPQANEIAHLARHLVFSSATVRTEFEYHEPYIRGSVQVKAPGLEYADSRMSNNSDTLRRQLGLRKEDRLVIGTGRGTRRRGFDRFVMAAQRLCAEHDNLHFCWIGGSSREMKQWFRSLPRQTLKGRLHLLDRAPYTDSWLSAADALYLSSRIDAYPRDVLQALSLGKPVVIHEGATGFDEPLLSLLQQADIDDNDAIDSALRTAVFTDSPEQARQRQAYMREHHQLRDYVRSLLSLIELPMTQAALTSDDSLWQEPDTLTLANG
ncbi:glycosyltransferase [Granulosicoccus sp. 3-233]|uniref:glycosyltransferase n=1 Tax=Granulosicoccus sp. 3-233 TaxID=3417969 RepID=UPI003D358167